MRHWVFSCKQISALISLSMDKKLSFSKRMGIKFHLMMCVLCRRYRRQLLFIRSVLRRDGGVDDDSTCQTLSSDARKRIEKKLHDETR